MNTFIRLWRDAGVAITVLVAAIALIIVATGALLWVLILVAQYGAEKAS